MQLRDGNPIYEDYELELFPAAPALSMTELTVLRCKRPKNGEPRWIYECEPAQKYQGGCTKCGSVSYIGYGSNSRYVHDVNVGITKVDIDLTVPRFKCKDCHGFFNYPFESIPESKSFTNRAMEQIQRDMFFDPFTRVAEKFGCSEGTVRNIMDDAIEVIEANRPPVVAPRVLGIDEKHIGKAMRGVFVDIETRELLEMTEHNKEADVIRTIESMIDYDKNIEIVTMDMANSYKKYVQICLPNARIVVDKYHVFQDLSRKVSSTKTKLMEMIALKIKYESDFNRQSEMKTARDLLLRNTYLFKFGRKKLTEKDSRIIAMAEVCSVFPEFNHLRLLKQGFEHIYDAKSRPEAEALYRGWQDLVPPTGSRQKVTWEAKYGVSPELFADFRTITKVIKNWYEEVFTYFEPGCQVTNAAAEGINSTIQRINSDGTGYGFKHLRAKALYCNYFKARHNYSLRPNRVKNGKYVQMGQAKYLLSFGAIQPVQEIYLQADECISPLAVYARIPYDAEFYDFSSYEDLMEYEMNISRYREYARENYKLLR